MQLICAAVFRSSAAKVPWSCKYSTQLLFSCVYIVCMDSSIHAVCLLCCTFMIFIFTARSELQKVVFGTVRLQNH